MRSIRYLLCIFALSSPISLSCTSTTIDVSGDEDNLSERPTRGRGEGSAGEMSLAGYEGGGEGGVETVRDIGAGADEDWSVLRPDLEIRRDMELPTDPCVGVDCGANGVCVSRDQVVTCQCDPRYVLSGLMCVPEDVDRDGFDFTQDCDDQQANISPSELERCDEVDQDCDGEIDEGACSIWVLEPRASRWDSYPLNPSGSPQAPQSPIKAAWDVETEDLAFVLTADGYHEFRMSTFTWSPERPRDNIFNGLNGPIRHAAFAYSVPADHTNPAPPRAERITLTIADAQGAMRVWQISYIIDEQRFIPKPGGLYNQEHEWTDVLAPAPNEVKASWIDIENQRFLLNVDPRDLCGSPQQTSNIYNALLSADRLYLLEAGLCFKFITPTPLIGSPLDLPNAPRFDEVGAAFLHRGAFYLFRGD